MAGVKYRVAGRPIFIWCLTVIKGIWNMGCGRARALWKMRNARKYGELRSRGRRCRKIEEEIMKEGGTSGGRGVIIIMGVVFERGGCQTSRSALDM